MGNKIRDYVGGLLIGLLFTACTSLTTDKDWTRNGKVRLVLNWGTRAAHTGVSIIILCRWQYRFPSFVAAMLWDMREPSAGTL